jgi:hypothetical protein
MLRTLMVAVVLAAIATIACTKPPIDTLVVERGIVTVSNQTPDEWTAVEIWLNQNFRVTVPSIAAGSRFQVPVNAFVTGYGQRFDFSRMQLTDVRLAAKTPGGEPVEHRMAFRQGGLAGAFGGKKE